MGEAWTKEKQIATWLEAERDNIGRKLVAVDYRSSDAGEFLRYSYEGGVYVEWNLLMQREVLIAPKVLDAAS